MEKVARVGCGECIEHDGYAYENMENICTYLQTSENCQFLHGSEFQNEDEFIIILSDLLDQCTEDEDQQVLDHAPP